MVGCGGIEIVIIHHLRLRGRLRAALIGVASFLIFGLLCSLGGFGLHAVEVIAVLLVGGKIIGAKNGLGGLGNPVVGGCNGTGTLCVEPGLLLCRGLGCLFLLLAGNHSIAGGIGTGVVGVSIGAIGGQSQPLNATAAEGEKEGSRYANGYQVSFHLVICLRNLPNRERSVTFAVVFS